MTGKSVRLSFTTDEELIGGIVTRIGSTIYDGSVRNQLQQVKEKISRERMSMSVGSDELNEISLFYLFAPRSHSSNELYGTDQS